MAKINLPGLRKEISKQYYRQFIKQTQVKLNKELDRIKRNMINSFDNHQITKDIEAGPGGSNLPGGGDLFSLIGFESGDSPTTRLRQVLINSLSVKVSGGRGGNISFLLNINLPTQEEVRAATPLPWAGGRSWVDEVERGVSGLGRYLVKKSPSSRSGAAIQVEGNVGNSKMGPIPYISQIINGVMKDISSLRIK